MTWNGKSGILSSCIERNLGKNKPDARKTDRSLAAETLRNGKKAGRRQDSGGSETIRTKKFFDSEREVAKDETAGMERKLAFPDGRRADGRFIASVATSRAAWVCAAGRKTGPTDAAAERINGRHIKCAVYSNIENR